MAVGEKVRNEGVRFSRLDRLVLLAGGEAELLVGGTTHASPELTVEGEDEKDAAGEELAGDNGLWTIAVDGGAAV